MDKQYGIISNVTFQKRAVHTNLDIYAFIGAKHNDCMKSDKCIPVISCCVNNISNSTS
jgi:hypothetical protein